MKWFTYVPDNLSLLYGHLPKAERGTFAEIKKCHKNTVKSVGFWWCYGKLALFGNSSFTHLCLKCSGSFIKWWNNCLTDVESSV